MGKHTACSLFHKVSVLGKMLPEWNYFLLIGYKGNADDSCVYMAWCIPVLFKQIICRHKKYFCRRNFYKNIFTIAFKNTFLNYHKVYRLKCSFSKIVVFDLLNRGNSKSSKTFLRQNKVPWFWPSKKHSVSFWYINEQYFILILRKCCLTEWICIFLI